MMIVGTAAAHPRTRTAAEWHAFLRPPFDRLTPEEILGHFQKRKGVQYFPVPDPGETQPEKIDAILDNHFEFNGESYRLPELLRWTQNPSQDIEWLILLHKFYYAVGLGMRYQETGDTCYRKKWVSLTSSWIEQTPPGFIASDVTGRRIQNWIYAQFYFVTNGDSAGLSPDFFCRFLASLHSQIEYLRAHLTPSRNHRTLELYAIFLAAVVFPEMRGADIWLEFSLAEIVKNVESDLLPDGVHCELSTDYHHTVLKNFLCIRRLAELNCIAVPARMDERIQKALEFSLYIHKPDGLIPSLSDGDVHGYLDLLAQGDAIYGSGAMRYAATRGAEGAPPPHRSVAFPDSGYYVLRSGWGERNESYRDEKYLVFDCGPLGAGNHGHFDLLSIEAAAYGRSLIVDPGRYTYDEEGEINWRAQFRGTAYHNTVLVDGKNQTRYEPGKSKMKVRGPGPRHECRAFVNGTDFDFLHGMAKSSEYGVVHERRILFISPEYWVVSDYLKGEGRHRYDLLFHLSPEAHGRTEKRLFDGTCLIQSPNLVMAQCDCAEVSVAIDEGFVSSEYGKKAAAPVVRFTRNAREASFLTVLYPFEGDPPVLQVCEMLVHRESGEPVAGFAQAFRITVDRGGVRFTDICFFGGPLPGDRWRFGNFTFDGDFLFLRLSAHRKILRQHASENSSLEQLGRPFQKEVLK